MPRHRKASALTAKFSKSLASRRQRPSHAKVRSTIQRLAKGTKPLASPRLTISSRQRPVLVTAAAIGAVGADHLDEGEQPARSSGMAPSRSWTSAGWIAALKSRPSVSTRMCRFLPLTFLPAS
jgi:hypothetical protein